MSKFKEKLQSLVSRTRASLAAMSGRVRQFGLGDRLRGGINSGLSRIRSPEFREQAVERTRTGLTALRTKLTSNLNREALRNHARNFDPVAIAEWAQGAFQRQNAGLYGTIATIVLCTWFLSDLTSLLLGNFIPEPPQARTERVSGGGPHRKALDEYNIVFARNLFNSKGIIPGEENPAGGQDLGGPPTRTTLPFNLIGTLILRNELRSIATIEDRSASQVYPVRVADEIPSKAKILTIEPRRVIFINTSSGRREFVDLPEDTASTAPRITVGAPKPGGGGIEKTSPTDFNVSRSEIDKSFADLNNVLTQARAVPNFENGVPAGYKLFQIVPGSIYDKLGLQNGDVIAGVNGEPINDPGKAFELLNQLKAGSSHLQLTVKRDGKSMENTYNIR